MRRRQRFSLAHEIGHIVIPWHIGTIACHTDIALPSSAEYHYRPSEAEANGFAAALLLPSGWVREQLAADSRLEVRLRALWDTGVSAPAACLRLVRFLDPGYLFALVDDEGRVELSVALEGTVVKPPERGSELREELFDHLSSER